MLITSETVAIVTGATSGLGQATAEMLAARGAGVAVLGRREEAGQTLARSIGALFVRADVMDDDGVGAAIEHVRSTLGTPRILVNCAGVAPGIRTVRRDGKPHPLAAFRDVIEANLVGTFAMVARFAAILSEAPPIGEERGVIVNTASTAAFEGKTGQAAYAASKAGIVGLTLPVARDLAPYLIRVMTIAPGAFETPMMTTLAPEAQAMFVSQVPHPARLGRPAEFAQLVETIITNPMLNGEVIRLDAALRMAAR